MNKKLLAIAAIATLSSMSVIAGGVSYVPDSEVYCAPPFPIGWYLSLNAGGTVVGEINKNGNQHSGFESYAITAYGGYQYDDTWAAEIGVGYHDMDNYGNFEIFDIAIKASMPINDYVNVFAKLGGAAYTLKVCDGGCASETKGAPFFGGGFGFQFSPMLRATVEYDGVYATSGMADGSLGAVTAGLTYYFL